MKAPPLVLDAYSLMIATPIAFALLVYYSTFKDLAPALAQAAYIIALIGVIGWLMTIALYLFARQIVGDITFAMGRMNVTYYENSIVTIGVLSAISLTLQLMVLYFGRAQSGVVAPTSWVDTLLFYQAAAIMEEPFFRFFLFRALRGLSQNWIIALMIQAAIFGGYHEAVYGGNPIYMTAAVIGGIVYAVNLQLTGRASFSFALHQLQNFRLT